MKAEEIQSTVFDGYDCLYVEGYLVQDHELIRGAMRTAKACGLKIAIDLASFNVVEENLEFLQELVRDYVDILFANEDEARAFTGEAEPLNALNAISESCELVVVKIGMKGPSSSATRRWCTSGSWRPPSGSTRRAQAISTPRDSWPDCARG